MNTITTEELSAYKAQGFTHIYRAGTQLCGVKLIEGKPVWHRI